MSIELRDERTLPIFIHRSVDDYGLSPNTFRIYAHLARRAGYGEAWPSYQSMGDHCFSMLWDEPTTRRRRAIECVKELVEKGLISKEERKAEDGGSMTNLIRLLEPNGAIAPPSANSTPLVLIAPKGTPIEDTTSDASHPSLGLFAEEQRDHYNTVADEPTTQAELLPVAVVLKPKDNACVKAYREFVGRYPNKAQMAMIAERNPEIESWNRAMRAWIGRGYNPSNIATMLEWSFDLSLAERRPAGNTKRDPTDGATWAELFAEQENRSG